MEFCRETRSASCLSTSADSFKFLAYYSWREWKPESSIFQHAAYSATKDESKIKCYATISRQTNWTCTWWWCKLAGWGGCKNIFTWPYKQGSTNKRVHSLMESRLHSTRYAHSFFLRKATPYNLLQFSSIPHSIQTVYNSKAHQGKEIYDKISALTFFFPLLVGLKIWFSNWNICRLEIDSLPVLISRMYTHNQFRAKNSC